MKNTNSFKTNIKNTKFYILLILFSYSASLYSSEKFTYNYFSTSFDNQVSSLIIKATNSTKDLIKNSIKTSKNFIDHLINFNKKDKLNQTLTISAVAALTSITAYTIKKTISDKNTESNNKNFNIELNNFLINNIIDNINFADANNNSHEYAIRFGLDRTEYPIIDNAYSLEDTQSKEACKSITINSGSKKWALWPNDMSFLSMIQIPQEIFLNRLISEIKTTYKNNNLDTSNQTKYQVESFIKDVENEISVYQKKYNIILISDKFERKEECLLKIKDNIKKLLYLKSTVTAWTIREQV